MKQKQIFIVYVVISLFVSMVMSCGRGRGRRSPPPDNTKPTIKCPPDIHAVADPFQIHTNVEWDENTISANDNRDGPIK